MSSPLVAVELTGWIDPEAVYLGLHGDDGNSFWLDAGPAASAGWSWVGSGDVAVDDERIRAVDVTQSPVDGWSAGPFRGGWVGWIGYEEGAARAGAPIAAASAPPPQWLRVDRFVAFDHAERRAWAVAGGSEADLYAAQVAAVAADFPPPPAPSPVSARARHAPDEYAALIERCRDSIREGDAYQLCLTTRFDVAATIDPVEAFRRLRAATPAHHGGVVCIGDTALVSASPERFLEVGAGIVRTRPIKGTRPRGADAAADAALAAELRASEKERAENVMIVDLMRNDLSRVCEAGTVGVDALLAIESYPAVHQLVSTVSGRLVTGTTVGGLLDAAFPAGSMTGAPKLSAMGILHVLESGPRGVFAGCFGWIGEDGALDLAMVIRSIVVRPGGAYVGAGGGITWRSDAAAEVAEVGIKAHGPLAAIGAGLPPGW
ncbi:chorismate-binding protein [Microbacterium sp. 2FI]|uniref:anthranilate synthase component I family protein n=1 Tax=Microbacterium sp. 2FI TaxID=2502193 RepID=UPI0010F9814A|nr:chorismate-binding protein [Microbacterium sp. 2FI]